MSTFVEDNKDAHELVEDSKGSNGTPETDVVNFVYDAELEKRLLRKIDWRLVPTVWLMSLFNYLDRGNIGNAAAAGMNADLGLSSSDYSFAVSIFFIGYLTVQVPSNMILARSKPRWYLSAIQLGWGCLCIAYIGVNSKGALYAVRLCLGIVEAGFFPGVLLYMSAWYRKTELAGRFSIFATAAWFSGAFSGLLAGAIINRLSGAKGLPAWKWLFLIEGLATIFLSLITPFVLPDFPANTTWLKPNERAYILARLADDHNADSAEEMSIGRLKALKMAVSDWRMWLFCFGQSLIAAAGSVSFFIPTLVTSLGYTGSMAQYMTVPIYLVAVVLIIGVCFSSDRVGERPKHIMAVSLLAVICISVVAGTSNPKLRYAFLCIGLSGVWGASPLNLSYLSNTISHPQQKRAIVIALINGIANLSSVYGSYIWPSQSAPRYLPGFVTVTTFMFGVFSFAAASIYLFKKYPYPEAKITVRHEPALDTEDAAV